MDKKQIRHYLNLIHDFCHEWEFTEVNIETDIPFEFKDDYECVYRAIGIDIQFIQYASERIQNDRDFILKVAKEYPNFIPKYCIEKFRSDKEIVLACVDRVDYALNNVDKKLLDDDELISIAVSKNGNALFYASNRLKDNKEIVIKTIQENGYALKHASDRLKDDKEIAILAIKKLVTAIEHCSERLKNDPEIAELTLQQDYSGFGLKQLSEQFKSNRDFVSRYVKKHPDALAFASPNLKNDIEIVLSALQSDEKTIHHASPEIKKLLKNHTNKAAALQSIFENNKLNESISMPKNNKRVKI